MKEAVDKLSADYKGSSLTDIFIIVDAENDELAVYDDEENCIKKQLVASWVGLPPAEEDLRQSVYARDLQHVITEMNEEKLFDSLNIFTPFSINLSDENFIVLEELLLIEDDSVLRLENDLIDRLGKEFDDFLEKLLND